MMCASPSLPCAKASLITFAFIVNNALIVHQGLVPPRIHKLPDLLSQVHAAPLAAMATEIQLLDRFYTTTRYPGFTPDGSQSLPNQRDAEEALEIAQRVLAYVTDLVAA